MSYHPLPQEQKKQKTYKQILFQNNMKIYTQAELTEKETIETLLKKHGVVETARLGNMSYLTLIKRMKYFNIPNVGKKNSGRKRKVFHFNTK